MQVLVINSGSSSVKFELFDVEAARSLLRGEVERIGESDADVRVESAPGAQTTAHAEMGSPRVPGTVGRAEPRSERPAAVRDHHEAMGIILGILVDAQPPADVREIVAVGHRVVHGGERFTGPVLIDDGVLEQIRGLALLAPLHAKANVAGIEAARAWLPDIPQVAVFDTTFHRTMPRYAREYALPRALVREHGIRRYGFHGTSHSFVARRAATMLGRPPEELDLITLHLGNGASVSAIRGGRSVDTSMGMTPLEGLVMGTRCGDVDPAVPMLIGEITGRSREDVHRLLNFESGLYGLTGENDMREVHRLAEEGDSDARLAIDMFCYRARKYLGAYYAVLGRVDAVVFTAGIGEHDAEVRSRICGGLERFGIEVDEEANRRAGEGAEPETIATDRAAPSAEADGERRALRPGERFISPPGAEVAVLVIPTDEELEIARAAYACACEVDEIAPRASTGEQQAAHAGGSDPT